MEGASKVRFINGNENQFPGVARGRYIRMLTIYLGWLDLVDIKVKRALEVR